MIARPSRPATAAQLSLGLDPAADARSEAALRAAYRRLE